MPHHNARSMAMPRPDPSTLRRHSGQAPYHSHRPHWPRRCTTSRMPRHSGTTLEQIARKGHLSFRRLRPQCHGWMPETKPQVQAKTRISSSYSPPKSSPPGLRENVVLLLETGAACEWSVHGVNPLLVSLDGQVRRCARNLRDSLPAPYTGSPAFKRVELAQTGTPCAETIAVFFRQASI